MIETEQMLERMRSLLPDETNESQLFYCMKQHLWYRATPIRDSKNDNDDDTIDKYLIEVGLAPRALESVGDILYIVLYDKNGPKLELTSKRDNTDEINKYRKSSLHYEEGELMVAITWEGIEQQKGDEDFYLITGRNIWRCPIRGMATINMEYIDRNWTIHPPDTGTVILYIECTKEDYYHKINHLYDGPLVTPDVENSTSPENRQKKRIDKTLTTTTDDPIENYCHPWLLPMDYETYIEANEP
jgi:hypothetical protein